VYGLNPIELSKKPIARSDFFIATVAGKLPRPVLSKESGPISALPKVLTASASLQHQIRAANRCSKPTRLGRQQLLAQELLLLFRDDDARGNHNHEGASFATVGSIGK